MVRRAAGPVLGVLASGALLLAGCSGGSSPAGVSSSTTVPAGGTSTLRGGLAGQLQDAYISAVNRVLPSVVEISTPSGLGSGVVYDGAGDVVTNAHVVGDFQQPEVTLADGRNLPGVLVGAYQPDDLAVIRIKGPNLPPPVVMADSSTVAVGEIVLAVGNPLGLSSSVTEGIVSFNGRTVGEGNGVVLPSTIQTSAAINPGNSGGALIDLDARVIGIPTLVAGSAESGAAAGIGFAIPANTVKLIAGQLAATGHVTDTGRAALAIRGATAVLASGQAAGVVVVTVSPGGAAERAGIRAGDLLTAVNRRTVNSLAGLADVMAGLKPGSVVPVTVERSGRSATFDVTLDQLPAG